MLDVRPTWKCLIRAGFSAMGPATLASVSAEVVDKACCDSWLDLCSNGNRFRLKSRQPWCLSLTSVWLGLKLAVCQWFPFRLFQFVCTVFDLFWVSVLIEGWTWRPWQVPCFQRSSALSCLEKWNHELKKSCHGNQPNRETDTQTYTQTQTQTQTQPQTQPQTQT